ncbi:MAG: starch-binding protein [Prevotella sp.]|nr:starch-binding protein [Prevotella sp.]
MKKKLFLFIGAMLATVGVQAQMAAYSVQTNVVGDPGEPTVVDLQGTTGKDLSGCIIDADGNIEFNSAEELKGFPIGFEFRYNSQKMTHFLIGTDLAIQLSPKETISTDVHKNRVSAFTTEGIHDVIGMFPREGVYGLDDTQISFWLEGQEGYRALVVEYKNIDFGNGGSWGTSGEFCGAKATIQYRLYEQSGNIEMKVKGMKPSDPGKYNFFRIGILGDANDFVQVQSWDGSVVSARDNSISYKADQYPIDGQVFTFVAPEKCVSPTVSGSDLVLSSTSDQILGTFAAGNGDHYLVLATTEAELSEKPADGTKYKVGDAIGSAKVIATSDRAEFNGAQGMEQGTYNVFVIAFNSLCMDGPLYCAEAISATIALKPAKPAALAVSGADKNAIKLSATDSGAQIVIAVTDVQQYNDNEQALGVGLFGTPTGSYNVGDAIDGGGKVVYVGSSSADISVSNLEAGKVYFFRAWSTDGNGGYSSEWLDANALTAAELPWEPMLEGTSPSEPPLGWTAKDSENDYWTVEDYNDLYLYNNVNYVDGVAETWIDGPAVYLNEGSNWLSVEIGANSIPVRWAADWDMAEGDEIAIQLTTDGTEYKNILTLNKDNMPEYTDGEETVKIWKNGEFTTFRVNFSEYAGQKVNVRLYVKRATKGQVNFRNLKLEGTLYGIVGTIPGLTWDGDLFMVQDKDNKNVYTASLDVTIDEVPAESYEYKLRTNQSWDGYQLPASGNQEWQPTETGDYALIFTADVANNTLSLSAQRLYEVSFANEAGWSEVYAYTWVEDGHGNVIAEPSGAWPGTKVEVSGGWFNRSWTYNFTSEQQPQFIIWNNGGGNPDYEEAAAQTENLVFVNGKKYSVYPDITSVKISGEWNDWNGEEMTVTDYNDKAFQTTVNLTGIEADQEFKLVVNGEWIGYGEVTLEDEKGFVSEGSENGNLKLKGGNGYDIVAFWSAPSATVKNGWILEITENTTVGVESARANAKHNTIHNLKGQRLSKMQRGINIVNGQKKVSK